MSKKVPHARYGAWVRVVEAGHGRLVTNSRLGYRHGLANQVWWTIDREKEVPVKVGQVGRVLGWESHVSGIGLMGGGSSDLIVQFEEHILGFWSCSSHRSKEERYLAWVNRCATLEVVDAIQMLGDLADDPGRTSM